MGRQIKLLTKISLYSLFRLNEFRHTKDKKKKARFCMLGAVWILSGVLLAAYVCSLSYGLIRMRMGYFVPALLSMSVSAVVFLFTMLKAGSVLFDKHAYEKQIALPVTIHAVIISRFLTMYVTSLLSGMLIMLPGMAVYAVMEKPGISFYLYGLPVIIFLPLLPLTAASIAGALIAGVSCRWRRKNLVTIVLTLLLAAAAAFASFGSAGMDDKEFTDMLQQAASMLSAQIQRIYPPALWLSEVLVHGSIRHLFLFLGISLGSFLIFLEILQHFYADICSLLSVQETRGDYQMKSLYAKSVMRSMTERELRRYFSSAVYVANTLIGEILMTSLAAALLVMGKEQAERMLGMPGITGRALPILLGMMPALTPMTASCISMEGKQWWMMQTLPVTKKDILRSKMLAGLLVVFPFYLVSELLVFFALKPGAADAAGLLAVPAVYIVFSIKTGAAVNLKFPVFDWENETQVIKQSASVLLTMLLCGAAGLVPLGALLYFPNAAAHLVYAVWACILLAVMSFVLNFRRM